MRKTNIKIIALVIILCAVNSLAAQFAKYNKKAPVPPIYTVLDFIATHPVSECAEKEKELAAIVSAPNFDVNARHQTMLPPLAYLLRTNKNFLNGFSPNYISDNVWKILLEKGANINTYDSEGNSLLLFALITGNKKLVQYFMEKGIHLSKENNSGLNILYYAVQSDDTALVKIVLTKEEGRLSLNFFNIEQCIDNQNPTMLHILLSTHEGKHVLTYGHLNHAIASGNLEIVKMIENERFDINLKTITIEPSAFQKHVDVYNYVTKICADKSIEKNDILKFQKQYPDKAALVQKKLDIILAKEQAERDRLARLEIDDANKYIKVEKSDIFFAQGDGLGFWDYIASVSQDLQNKNIFIVARVKNVGKLPKTIKANIVLKITHYQRIRVLFVEKESSWISTETDNWYLTLQPQEEAFMVGYFKFQGKYHGHSAGLVGGHASETYIDINNAFDLSFEYYNQPISDYQQTSQTKLIEQLRTNGNVAVREGYQSQYFIAKEQARQEKIRICNECVIDATKTTIPHQEKDWLNRTSDKPGTIVMKNGETYQWWYNKDGKSFRVINWIFDDTYKTWADMERAFIKECKLKKCP